MSELVALLDGEAVGVVEQKAGRLSFRYHDAWRTSENAYPLSLSLPLAARDHGHASIHAFLWGLLPDNERVLERWAKQFHVSAGNAFALLSHVGQDCAGAVQFVPPAKVDSVKRRTGGITWLSDADVTHRLRTLTLDATAWRAPDDEGQFSLAGAQPKTALHFDGRRWGIPSGAVPTTHILKPTLATLDGHAENEYLCLSLAASLGMVVARASVQCFEEITTFVVERYDRVRNRGKVRRLHQEDLCQALGQHPSTKYENEGGPSAVDVVDVLRSAAFGGDLVDQSVSAAEVDVWRFVDALAFNWLIGGTDAHAKNYSLLLGANGLVRLAPLYDVASILAYPDVNPRKAKLAMKIGGKYRLDEIGLAEWQAFGKQLRLSEDALIPRIRSMAERLPQCLATGLAKAREEALDHPLLAKLGSRISERAARCARGLRARPT
jgi:serine/threonine-protein kinase HipA